MTSERPLSVLFVSGSIGLGHAGRLERHRAGERLRFAATTLPA